MSITYPDLTNDFPDIESDERYLYRDMTIDDLPYVVQYEKLLIAAKAASDGQAGNSSAYQAEWNALLAFKETVEYKEHVEQVNMTAMKFQTIEDKSLSAQRFSKRQQQQWIISETQPADNEQAVDDVWFRIDEITEYGLVNTTPFYRGDDGVYHEFTVSPKLTFSSNEDINNIIANTVTNPSALINNEQLQYFKRQLLASVFEVSGDTLIIKTE